MFIGQVSGRRWVRQRFVMLAGILACLGLLIPSIVAAQSDLATPVDPAATEDVDFGAQAVVFARFTQSQNVVPPGGSIDISLTVTVSATENTAGEISIPGPGELNFSFTGADRTENVTACDGGGSGEDGISASYVIATGSGTCTLHFSVLVPESAQGSYTLSATVSENGQQAGTASTSFSVAEPGISAQFSRQSYNVESGGTIPVSLVIDVTGPVANGTASIPVPVPEPLLPDGIVFGSPSATVGNGGSGTCQATLDSGAISVTFSEPNAAAVTQCVVTFDLSAAMNMPAHASSLISHGQADGGALLYAVAELNAVMATNPLVQFNPDIYVVSVGGSGRGIINVGSYSFSPEKTITVSSPIASISSPQVLSTDKGATCTVGISGETATIVISVDQDPPVQQAGSCMVMFTFTLNPDVDEVQESTIDATYNFLPASLLVFPELTPDISASFDQSEYFSGIGDTFDAVLTLTLPAMPDVESSGAFQVPVPQVSGSSITNATSTILQGPDNSCAVNFEPYGAAGVFTPSATQEVVCTFTFEMSVAESSPGGTGTLIAHISHPLVSLPPIPSAMVVVTHPTQLTLELDKTTAATGENVQVTIVQTSRSSSGEATISGTLPDGATYVDGSASISCTSLCSGDPPTIAVTLNSVSGTYGTDGNGTTTTTLTYTINVAETEDTTIEFAAKGRLPDGSATFAEPATLSVQSAAPTASEFTLVVEAGGTVSGSLENHITSSVVSPTYASDPPTGAGSFDLDPATGAFTYTAPGAPGSDSISYTITDTTNRDASGTIIVNIIEPLVTHDVSHDQKAGTTFTFDLYEAIEGGQAPHTFTEVAQDLDHGTVTIDATGLLTYVANADGDGTDTVTYDVIDGLGLPEAAFVSSAAGSGTITITVWQPLVIAPFTLTVDPGATVTHELSQLISGGLPPFTFSLQEPPTQGTATIDPTTGLLTFTANANASGSDTFTFVVSFTEGATDISAAADITGTVAVTYAQAPTATATSPIDPTATSTPDPNSTATETSTPDPDATSTSPSDSDDPDSTATAGADAVTQLPSTGSGGSAQAPFAVLTLMVAAMLILCMTARRRLTR